MIVVAVVAALSQGCNESRTAGPPPQSAVNLAEDEFERITKRLEYALEEARPPAGSGVVAERKCRYRLIAPSEKDDAYTADVTIETTTRLAEPKNLPRAKTKPRGQAVAEPVGEDEPPPDSDHVLELVAASRNHRKEKFQLIFENDRWKLATPPAQEIDRLLFEYALAD